MSHYLSNDLHCLATAESVQRVRQRGICYERSSPQFSPSEYRLVPHCWELQWRLPEPKSGVSVFVSSFVHHDLVTSGDSQHTMTLQLRSSYLSCTQEVLPHPHPFHIFATERRTTHDISRSPLPMLHNHCSKTSHPRSICPSCTARRVPSYRAVVGTVDTYINRSLMITSPLLEPALSYPEIVILTNTTSVFCVTPSVTVRTTAGPWPCRHSS